jgi:ADP-ribosylglycohydrolase
MGVVPTPQMGHAQANASLQSRVRGLYLGLALGDAVGSTAGALPTTGRLEAGVATQLAAWTAEGTLRAISRYGSVHPELTDIVLSAYQRWATLRGVVPPPDWYPHFWPEGSPDHQRIRGWLVDVADMAETRGSSPSTIAALQQGKAVRSFGCQALVRVLTVAPMALIQHQYFTTDRPDPNQACADTAQWARNLALLTHEDGERQAVSAAAVSLLVESLSTGGPLQGVAERALGRESGMQVLTDRGVFQQVHESPRSREALNRLAPDKRAWSALAGGLYVALSFPGEDTVHEALSFAAAAPDGDSVAAVAGAILGARHGYEAMPSDLISRLELGWVMDRLAIDMAAELVEHQGGTAWKDDGGGQSPAVDPWWDTKYPGV